MEIITMNANLASVGGKNERDPNTAYVDFEGQDPQLAYPRAACIFVANLPQSESDADIKSALEGALAKYGQVFVKIRRPSKGPNVGMPVGFCQFTNAANAQAAMAGVRGTNIMGRACRAEPAKANCSFIVFRKDGTDVTVEEVKEAVKEYGDVDTWQFLDAEAIGVPQQIVQFMFTMVQHGRTIVKDFEAHPDLGVLAWDGDVQLASAASREITRAVRGVEVRTAYVGNLDLGVNETHLRIAFRAMADSIESVEIHHRELPGRYNPRCFAFIVFRTEADVATAVANYHDTFLFGHPMAVQPRNPTGVKSERRRRRTRNRNHLGLTVNTGAFRSSRESAMSTASSVVEQEGGKTSAGPSTGVTVPDTAATTDGVIVRTELTAAPQQQRPHTAPVMGYPVQVNGVAPIAPAPASQASTQPAYYVGYDAFGRVICMFPAGMVNVAAIEQPAAPRSA